MRHALGQAEALTVQVKDLMDVYTRCHLLMAEWDRTNPYEWRRRLRSHLPWFLINLGVADKGEDCEAVGAKHLWYNFDNVSSGCHYCKVKRKGRLWASAKPLFRELLALVNEWDPIGLLAGGAPKDEYECLVGPVMRLLQDGKSPEDIAEYLDAHIPEHFGVDAPPTSLGFARRAHAWFQDRPRTSE